MRTDSPILQPLTPEEQGPIIQTDMFKPLGEGSSSAQQSDDLNTTFSKWDNLPGVLDQPVDIARKRIQAATEHQSSFMPNLIATLAALKGNFGPAFQLQEQKRKTAVAQKLMPEVVEINKLASQGKLEQAMTQAQLVASAAGDRVPELVPFFQDINKRISDQQSKFEQLKLVRDTLKVRTDEYKARTGQDDPRLADYKVLDLAVKNRSNVSEAYLNQMIQQQQLKEQRIDNIMSVTSPTTGITNYETTPQAVKASQVENPVGYAVAAKYGIPVTDVANVLNGQAVKGIGEIKTANIKEEYSALQDILSAGEMGKGIPIDPATTLALYQQGYTTAQIYQRQFGKEGAGAVQDLLAGRRKAETIATQQGIQEVDPFLPAAKGYTAIGINPSAQASFLTPMKLMSYSEAKQYPNDIGFVSTEILNKKIIPAQQALTGLQYIPLMFKERQGDPNSMFPQISAFVAKQIADYAGIPINEHITVAKAAELTVRQSIEKLEQTGAITEKAAGDLKKLMTGAFANQAGAEAAVQYMTGRIYEELQKAVGTHIIPDSAIPDTVKKYMPNMQQGEAIAPAGAQGQAPPLPGTVAGPQGPPVTKKNLKLKW